MGENEQGGMLRNVVVIGLVAMIALIVVFAVVGLKGNMLAGTSNATDRIQKEIKNANGGVEEVTDDYDTSSHYYGLDGSSKTAYISTYKSGAEKEKGAIVVPSYVTHNGVKYTVTKIDSSAYYSSELTSVTIPDTIKTIGSGAFSYSSSLTSVNFGKGVETIGNSAFSGTALSSVTVPDNVKTIGDSAFLYDEKLTSVSIGKNVETIGKSAFQYTALTSVIIPDNVKTIGPKAFSDISDNKDGFASIGKNTSYNNDGWDSSFGSYWDSNVSARVGYKPTIRS